jgi:hypothetical protein
MQTTPVSRYRAARPTSLGDHEVLAGITDRRAFWKPYQSLANIDVQHYIDTAMAEADKLIEARVHRGELSLLWDINTDKQMRAKRMREFKRAAV